MNTVNSSLMYGALTSLLLSSTLAIAHEDHSLNVTNYGDTDTHTGDTDKNYKSKHKSKNKKSQPVATYSPSDALSGDVITEGGELVNTIEEFSERWYSHKLSHDKTPIETRSLPRYFHPTPLLRPSDYVIKKDEMVVINPAPGEYVYVMEGQRHNYTHSTVAITATQPNGGAPLHTHIVEESHVLLEGKMRYQLGDEIFEVQAPYVINIPSMVPHAFMNLDKKDAELIAFFPDNKWEFDIVEHLKQNEFFDPNLEYETID